jgi:CO/xanthine dehydrogenase FAD-binding subunit
MPSVPAIAASRKRIVPFRLFQPTTIEAVCELMAQWPGAMLHAGGIDLVARMKAGIAPTAVITLNGVAALKGIARVGNTLEIGATTTHWQLEYDRVLRAEMPAMADFVADLGNVRVRAQGTIGGNIMAAEPGYEMLPLLAVLDGELRFVDCRDGTRRAIAARAWPTANLNPAELLTAIAIPLRPSAVVSDRTLRPLLGLVAATEWREDVAISGFAALTGQGPVWSGLDLPRPLPRRELLESADSIGLGWASRLPPFATTAGAGDAYCRRVAQVILRRAIERMARTNS